MNKKIELLHKKVIKIQELGYIKGVNKSKGAAGITFERLLGISPDNFEIPDYNGIEIKTITKNSNSIKLFSANPDGKYLFEVERLKNTYGYPDYKEKKFKVLGGTVAGNRSYKIGLKYKYKLVVNYEEKELVLYIYDNNDNLIEKEISWSFDLLENRIMNKLLHMAIIYADSYCNNNTNYYYYYKAEYYCLKDFATFLELIEKGIIYIKINIGVYYSEKRYGQTYNHGIGFCINKENLHNLFFKYEF